jgi:hypothetical protein
MTFSGLNGVKKMCFDNTRGLALACVGGVVRGPFMGGWFL